jgi:hypothetical protein
VFSVYHSSWTNLLGTIRSLIVYSD